ncbi:MAG: hypothetical protein DCC65_15555 [Planctomycetota bacterium]|nr:MAG: hypothetical protein DCC65_15555 [Planctomycetota bacterium]
MATGLRQCVTWLTPWRRFCGLVVLLYLARGVFLLCVLPPFEGWDEYQHLACIVHVVEHGQSPAPGEGAAVPRSMYPGIVRYPHSALGVEQLGALGALPYEAYWERGASQVRPDAPAIALYQAQHGPLYYRAMAMLVRPLLCGDDPLAVISGLRLINVLLGAAAVGLFLLAIGHLTRDAPDRYMAALLVAVQPIFLLNTARVANDALAVFLGTAALCLILLGGRKSWWRVTAASGVIVGLAVLAKSVNLAVAAFGGVALLFMARRWKAGGMATAVGLAVYFAGAAIVTAGYFAGNLNRFGMLTPMQEAVQNRAAGRTTADFFTAITRIDWLRESWRMLSRKSLWVGGWSMLKPPALLVAAYQGLVALVLTGAWFALSRRRRCERSIFSEPGTGRVLCILLVLFVAGLGYHAVHTKMALGMVATNSWYAAVVMPWMILLGVQWLRLLPGRRTCGILGAAWCLLYLITETASALLVMLPTYAASDSPSVIWQRTAAMHPAWLSPGVGVAALPVVTILSVAALAVWRGRYGALNDSRHEVRS